jgi:hypothetical protein
MRFFTLFRIAGQVVKSLPALAKLPFYESKKHPSGWGQERPMICFKK